LSIETLVLMERDNIERARHFVRSTDLSDAMVRAEAIDRPSQGPRHPLPEHVIDPADSRAVLPATALTAQRAEAPCKLKGLSIDAARFDGGGATDRELHR
jgi:hypothetical protein